MQYMWGAYVAKMTFLGRARESDYRSIDRDKETQSAAAIVVAATSAAQHRQNSFSVIVIQLQCDCPSR